MFDLFFAFSPILVLMIFLFVLKWPLFKAAPLTFCYTAVAAVAIWSLPANALVPALLKGMFLSFDIMLIVFGAIFFLKYLEKNGLIKVMEENLKSLSQDPIKQALLLAWIFGGFIEGVSGFGTPAVIVAPLLVSMGHPPINAIMIALMANSTAVAFGAVGTPIRIGFGGLEISQVPWRAALINLGAGMSVPLAILAFVTKTHFKNSFWRNFMKGVPCAMLMGLFFLIPYAIVARYGYEFPSLVGGIVGIMASIIYMRISDKEETNFNLKKFVIAFSPYLYLVALLIIGKIFLSSVTWKLSLGAKLSHTLQLFNPGFAFLTLIILFTLIKRKPLRELLPISSQALGPLKKTAIAIFFIGSMTYTMISTGLLESSKEGMLQLIAASILTPELPYYAAFIGAFGSFLTGSATVSNLLFGQLQAGAAHSLDLSLSWILALQLVGAGAGNIIALSNILAVQAAVGIEGQESKLLQKLIIPCLIYLVLASIQMIAYL